MTWGSCNEGIIIFVQLPVSLHAGFYSYIVRINDEPILFILGFGADAVSIILPPLVVALQLPSMPLNYREYWLTMWGSHHRVSTYVVMYLWTKQTMYVVMDHLLRVFDYLIYSARAWAKYVKTLPKSTDLWCWRLTEWRGDHRVMVSPMYHNL